MKKSILILGVVVGSILAAGPLWGVIGMTVNMTRAFRVLDDSGVANPKALSDAIGNSLASGAVGLAACPIGIILAATCIIFLILGRKRQRIPGAPPPVPGAPPAGFPELPF